MITLIAIGVSLMLLFSLAFVLFFNFSREKLRNEQLNFQRVRLKLQEQLLHDTILAQEKERQRIAKDLHDEIGSKLNVLHLNSHLLIKKIPTNKEGINQMIDIIDHTITSVRRISYDLLPPTLEGFGLCSAIDELCERYQQVSEMEVTFEVKGKIKEPRDKLVELNLYRILQELMSNTLKYAQADKIDIYLDQFPMGIRLSYQDNGKGFNPEKLDNRKGLGMQNILSRLQMIAAQYELITSENKGLTFNISVKNQD